MEHLPPEILTQIVDLVDIKDKCSLGSTSHEYRTVLSPFLFATLKFSRLQQDIGIVESLVEKYGRLVKRLHYRLDLYPDVDEDDNKDNDDEDDNKDKDDDTPVPPEDRSGVSDIAIRLLNGKCLPNVQALTIEFLPFNNFEGGGFADNEVAPFAALINDHSESASDVLMVEQKHSWRKVMRDSFQALAMNQSVIDLKFINLPPKATSAYASEEWGRFMQKLQSFDFGLWGSSDDDGDFTSINQPDYLAFVDATRGYFFEHLSSTKYVRFAAAKFNPIGYTGMNNFGLPLGESIAPQIQSLELYGCIIDASLMKLLTARSQTLKSLHLLECYSAAHYDDLTEEERLKGPISWADLFKVVKDSRPVLSDLVVTNRGSGEDDEHESSQPGGDDEQSEKNSDDDDDNDNDNDDEDVSNESDNEEDCEESQEQKNEDGHESRFPYIIIWEKWGASSTNSNIEPSVEEDDLRAFNALMEVVASNREGR